MKPKTKHETKSMPEAIAVARVIGGLPVELGKITEPLASVLAETANAKANKRQDIFKQSAKTFGLKDAAQLLADAKRVDPNATPAHEAELDLLNASEILTATFPDPVWAIPNLLPVGLSIFAGAPKMGKSWLALQIAQAVTAGGRVFDEQVKQGAVLYLALEDTPRRLQDRMRKQGWNSANAKQTQFLTIGGFEMNGQRIAGFEDQIGDLRNGGGERLAHQIEMRGYRLVVIDTFSRSVHGDQNDAKEMTEWLTPIQEIAHAQNTALLLIDHHRKGNGENPDAIGDILGSTAKGAMADTVWGLYRERGKSGAKLAITGREVEEKTLALKMDWLTGCWQCDGDADEIALTERRQEILDALGELGKPAQLSQLADAIGQAKQNTYTRLQDLVNAGLVKKESSLGKVFYSLPQTKGLL